MAVPNGSAANFSGTPSLIHGLAVVCLRLWARHQIVQHGFDKGRLICVITVAPAPPVKFVIFRIGRETDASPEFNV